MSAGQIHVFSSCQVPMPMWIRGDVLDVKRCVSVWEGDNHQETTAGEVPILALLATMLPWALTMRSLAPRNISSSTVEYTSTAADPRVARVSRSSTQRY